MKLRLLFATVIALLGLSAAAIGASAAPIFKYNTYLSDGADNVSEGGSVGVDSLDITKTTRMVVSPTGGAPFDQTQAAGPPSMNSGFLAGLKPGSTIAIRQPAASATATETYVIPSFPLDVTLGAMSYSGSFPAGFFGSVQGDRRCNLNAQSFDVGAGPFSFPHPRIIPGDTVQIVAHSTTGDFALYSKHAPGETPCIQVYGGGSVPGPTDAPPDANPYSISVQHLIDSVAPSVRFVLSRGGAVISDQSADNSYLNAQFGTKPLPGDVVSVYRPKTAPTPFYSVTLPQISSIFDPSIDVVAGYAPAAGNVQALPCRQFSCPVETDRTLSNVPAGRSLLNFAVAQGIDPAIDLLSTDVISFQYTDPDFVTQFSVQSLPGDLVAPTQSFKLSSKLKLKSLVKAFKRGYKISVKSNEVASAKLSLTLPAIRKKGKKKAVKAVTVASATKPLKIGTTSVPLKFTKSGKKALKKFRKGSSRSAVLTSTVTDAAGNASVLVKKTKIKA